MLKSKRVQLIISVNFVTVETEGYRTELTKIRAELEPWEKDLIVHRGKLDVASSETELLSKKVDPHIVITICLESRTFACQNKLAHLQKNFHRGFY